MPILPSPTHSAEEMHRRIWAYMDKYDTLPPDDFAQLKALLCTVSQYEPELKAYDGATQYLFRKVTNMIGATGKMPKPSRELQVAGWMFALGLISGTALTLWILDPLR